MIIVREEVITELSKKTVLKGHGAVARFFSKCFFQAKGEAKLLSESHEPSQEKTKKKRATASVSGRVCGIKKVRSTPEELHAGRIERWRWQALKNNQCEASFGQAKKIIKTDDYFLSLDYATKKAKRKCLDARNEAIKHFKRKGVQRQNFQLQE